MSKKTRNKNRYKEHIDKTRYRKQCKNCRYMRNCQVLETVRGQQFLNGTKKCDDWELRRKSIAVREMLYILMVALFMFSTFWILTLSNTGKL